MCRRTLRSVGMSGLAARILDGLPPASAHGTTSSGDGLLDAQVVSAIMALEGVPKFLKFIQDLDYPFTSLHQYHVLLEKKLLNWIAHPSPPDGTHKQVIERLGSTQAFWTPFLECFFVDMLSPEFFQSRRSRELKEEEEALLRMACSLTRYLCRYGDHGENFHNVVQLATYGACPVLCRILRYYRDRKDLCEQALHAVVDICRSKVNPHNRDEKNTAATLMDQVSDAPIADVLVKVLRHWARTAPPMVDLALRAIQAVANCSQRVRCRFGRVDGACADIFSALRYHLGCHRHAPAPGAEIEVEAAALKVETSHDSTNGHHHHHHLHHHHHHERNPHLAVCRQALKVMGTLCDTESSGAESSGSVGSALSAGGRDAGRDAFWQQEKLCDTVLGAMWTFVDDAHLVEFGFRSITKLVHRDTDCSRRERFGQHRLAAVDQGVCDVFFHVARRWVHDNTASVLVVDEGVKALWHLCYKSALNPPLFSAFFADCESDLTETRLHKHRVKAALELKLKKEVAEAQARGKNDRAKALEHHFPTFLRVMK